MLSPELKKLKKYLEKRQSNSNINPQKLLVELEKLEKEDSIFQESLSLSQDVCPTCGRSIV